MLYIKKKIKYTKSDTILFFKSISLERDVSVLSKQALAVFKYTNKLLCEWWVPNYELSTQDSTVLAARIKLKIHFNLKVKWSKFV